MSDLKELEVTERPATEKRTAAAKDDCPKTTAKENYEQQKAEAAARRKREKQIADTEAAIAALEEQQRQMETLLAEPQNQTQDNFQKYDHIKREIEQKMYEWEILNDA